MKESLSYPFQVNFTVTERSILEVLAEQNGATLSGTLRRLIREARVNIAPEGNADPVVERVDEYKRKVDEMLLAWEAQEANHNAPQTE